MATLIPLVGPELLKFAQQFVGKGPISDMIKEFDFSKVDVSSSSSDDYLHCDLAPSFGPENQTAEFIKTMDQKLLVMVGGAMKALSAIPQGGRTWEAVCACMKNSPTMVQDGEDTYRTDSLQQEDDGFFKFSQDPDPNVVERVHAWFKALINDAEVLASTKIDIDIMAKIVGKTGAAVETFADFVIKNEFCQKTLVDVGILRFPYPNDPYIKLYRIQLHAWSRVEHVIIHDQVSNGITGEYNCRKFVPNASVIEAMKDEAKQKAAALANDMWDD